MINPNDNLKKLKLKMFKSSTDISDKDTSCEDTIEQDNIIEDDNDTIDDITDDIIDKSSNKDPYYRLHDKGPKIGSKRSSEPSEKTTPKGKRKRKSSCSLQAYQINNIFFGSYAVLAGTEEALPTGAERHELDEALDIYITETNAQLSPGFVLLLAYTGYIMKNMNKPEVKKSFLHRIKQFFKRLQYLIFKNKRNTIKDVTNSSQ